MTEADKEQIEAAKAAMEIWQRFENSDISTMSDAEIKTCFEQREIIHNSAPALVRRVQELEDWQVKALPWLKDEVYRREKLAEHIYKSCAYMPDGDFYTTDDLTALIAEAKE